MRIAPPILHALRAGTATGAARAQEKLQTNFALVGYIEVAEIGACTVAEFPESAWLGSSVDAVGLVGSLGQSGAVAMLAMDPAVALGWLQHACPATDPAQAFPRLSELLYGELLAGVLAERDAHSSARSFEDSKLAVLVSTHAPPDTVILTVELALKAGPQTNPFQLHILQEPKRFAATFAT